MTDHDVAACRAAVARAAKAVRANGDDLDARRALRDARASLTEANLRRYISRAVADAPPIRPEVASELSILLFGGMTAGSAAQGAA